MIGSLSGFLTYFMKMLKIHYMKSRSNGTAAPGLSLPAVLGHVWSTFLKKPLGLYGLSFGGRVPFCLACMALYGDMKFINGFLIFVTYVFFYFVNALILRLRAE